MPIRPPRPEDPERLLQFKAEFFKALAHPVRIAILEHLRRGPRSVGELQSLTGAAGPSVSQQLAVLERETGVPLLVKAGRGVRLTDPALVLVGHADALLERVGVAEAELAAASGTVAGRARVASFHSALVMP